MKAIDVVLRPRARKALRAIQKKDSERIGAAIELLRFDPIPPTAKRLTGQSHYRIRIGKYRVVYSYEAKVLVIVIIDIGHRREVYKKLR